MQIISYRTSTDVPWQAGFEHDGKVIAATAAHTFGDQAPTVRVLLEAGPSALSEAIETAKKLFEAKEQELLSFDEIEVGPPVPDPDKIICLGLNYADHAAETNMALPKHPVLFPKYRNSLVGPKDNIVLPGFSEEIDYEAELAVVIGRTCKNVSEADALNYVAGYTIMNDVSARDWQFHTTQWMPGKAIDTFAPMGPGIVPAAAVGDPQTLKVYARVNGEVLQDGTTSQMIFSIAQSLAYISTVMTLVPGDIISTGTPAGVGFSRKPPVFLHAGDVVEIEVERVGKITNPVVAAQ
ncbi:MAG TPA: fumarylacetoacetate hydrolase family protein [Dictyobacter sp.]|jgi:2-keto-4-pentenoate hydratase/2-oxohepta-3-ene-1,7-dioic acid hydratase in catechol pathway|nr:fumarylacetoacetate hydrolase family protein [Dictyobacter sp.]